MIEAIGSALKIFAIWMGWVDEQKKENVGAVKHANSDLTAGMKEATDAQETREDVHRLSDAELNRRLRGTGPGDQQPRDGTEVRPG